MESKVYVCCICGVVFKGFGNNPWPVFNSSDGRCCDYCNATVVVPARVAHMMERDTNGTESR